MKGIILAGGTGSRLFPITQATCKQLLPVYDKPLVYYPLSLLLYAGIQDILIITTEIDLARFHALLGSGERFGVSLTYAVQDEPRGIAEAFLIGRSFIGESPVSLVLGDNIFHGQHLEPLLMDMASLTEGGLVFGYEVSDPCRYGVLDMDSTGHIKDIVEKPSIPPSSYAVTGLYAYDNDVVSIAQSLKPSGRGELEITDVNRAYLARDALRVSLLERGFAWLDTGTHEALQEASHYVQTLQRRQGISVACLEEIAFQKGWINEKSLEASAAFYASSSYGQYLQSLVDRSKTLSNV